MNIPCIGYISAFTNIYIEVWEKKTGHNCVVTFILNILIYKLSEKLIYFLKRLKRKTCLFKLSELETGVINHGYNTS